MIVRAKSGLILVGLLLILLPYLAVLQYRWIGEVSAAERDRLESSLRVASDRFATDFDTEFSRLANAFQIRDGFPETITPIAERYQAWTEANPFLPVVNHHLRYAIITGTNHQALTVLTAPQGLSEFLQFGL